MLIVQELNDLVGFQIDDQPIPDFASLLHEVNTVNRQMMIQVDGLRGLFAYVDMCIIRLDPLKGTHVKLLECSLSLYQTIENAEVNILP